MPNMKDILLWMQQQQNKPEFAAANRWQNRNQTPVSQEPKTEPVAEIIDEEPKEND